MNTKFWHLKKPDSPWNCLPVAHKNERRPRMFGSVCRSLVHLCSPPVIADPLKRLPQGHSLPVTSNSRAARRPMPLAAWERELVGGMPSLCSLLWLYPCACAPRTPQPSTPEWKPQAVRMMTTRMLFKLWKTLLFIKHLWPRPQNQCVLQTSGESAVQ